MTRIEARVRIERPVDEVFAYVSEPVNLPRWNSAVTAVRLASSGDEEGVGSTYVMQRELPIGRARNELEIVARERPVRFAIRTTSGPTPFAFDFELTPDGDATLIRLRAEAELEGVAELLGPLARFAFRRGVHDNLSALEAILDAPVRR